MRTIVSAKRKCGYKKKGGVYLVSEPVKKGILPIWVSLHPPVPCADRPHRGPGLVDADMILAREPEEEWFVGSSKDYREKLRADQWSLEKFGMTTTLRLQIGECAGLAGVDEAMEHLIRTVRFDKYHVFPAIEGLTFAEVHEVPRVALFYARLVEELTFYMEDRKAEHLVRMAAQVWRIAENAPPKLLPEIVPNLMRLLVTLGLTLDAMALRKRYL